MNNPDKVTQRLADQNKAARILAQRAEAMAQVAQVEAPGAQVTSVVIRLGRELFGLDVESVLEIRSSETITFVPRVPAWVLGVANIRGRVLSVVDLRAFFELPAGDFSEDRAAEAFLIVVKHQEMELLLWSREVVGVETLPVRQDLTESLLHPLRREYVQTVVERKTGSGNQHYLTVINIPALLLDPRLVVHEH